jgi:phospholipid/cholesterol/gamma-HCH transport system substrate-binding protein
MPSGLRTSSVFTLIKPIFGPAQLRAYTGVLTDPALEDARNDPSSGRLHEEVGRVIGATKDVLDNLNQFTAPNRS